MSERKQLQAKALAELEKLARTAVDRLDADDVTGTSAESITDGLDLGDVWDCVHDLLAHLVAEHHEERVAALLCPDCGGETESTSLRTRDPGDDRRQCVEPGCEGWAAW